VALVLVDLLAVDALDAVRRARAGADPFEVCSGLWADHPELNCLICDNPTGDRPFTVIMPAKSDRTRMTAAPLCAALPQMVRGSTGCLKLLRAMWSCPGRQVHFR
jgi:hypothetical protein